MTCSEVFPPRSIIYLPSTFYGQPFDISLSPLPRTNVTPPPELESLHGGAANP